MAAPYYPGALYTPNLGLALYGMDEVLAENMVLVDTAYGAGGSINVNGTLVPAPNLSSTLPVAPVGKSLVTFQFDANGNISAYVSTSGGSGTVTSFSAGNLSPLFTTSVATSTTTPALSFSLSNAAGGTVFGNATASAAAPGYTIAPVLGIPGTSTGTIALASSTASGKFTITAPASAATPILTLPTSSGVAVNVADGTVFTATIAASGTLTLATQPANTVFSGPTTGGAATPTFRALVAADIPSGTVIWNNIGNATGNLTLANGTNTTTFNQTSPAIWLWANTTTATVSTFNASPVLELSANYWTGSASSPDYWEIDTSIAAGTNAVSVLGFTHLGSTGNSYVQIGATGLQTVSTPFALDFNANAAWTLNFTNGSGVTTNGALTFGSSTLKLAASAVNTFLSLAGHVTTAISAPCVGIGNTSSFTATTGTQIDVQLANDIFNPASGSASFQAVQILPTIKGTSSGNTTALVINPTLTATALTGKNLIADFQSAGVSVFNVDYSGNGVQQNTTAAVVGTNQNSPIHEFAGTYFGSAAGTLAASAVDNWSIQDILTPVQLSGTGAVTTVAESAGSVVTVTTVGNTFNAGAVIEVSGFSAATWLNGYSVALLTANAAGTSITFNDPTAHGALGSTGLTGTPVLTQVSGVSALTFTNSGAGGGVVVAGGSTLGTAFAGTTGTITAQNTTAATVSTTNNSPAIQLEANYWTGSVSKVDQWQIFSALAAGTNGASTLSFVHTGSTATPNITVTTGGTKVLQYTPSVIPASVLRI